jgi:hypothetical protein
VPIRNEHDPTRGPSGEDEQVVMLWFYTSLIVAAAMVAYAVIAG